ncbi:MAG: dipeptide/oligopeptide/nickel ABC transporter ATP-binding protein [Desulfurococcales archaeon ex4484_217_2]|nr:MAG: dipeptide/oligopeptide/nickel ABC transporter ATP-binding protein [Desulfurococcales archaeon ex4484_217_2]
MKTLGLKRKILEVKDLHVHFYTYAGVVKAISGVSFEIYEGETFCLVGETGCGKSVTSRAITKLIESPGKIVKGQVLFYRDGSPIDLLKLSDEELRRIRGREIAYIFQDPTAALDPLYSVGYQIAETMVAHNTATWKEAFRRAVDILKSVLIPDPEKRVKNYPHELSGGMKQRVVIGISLSNKPKLLIADEPTTAVDVTIQAQILDLLRKLRQEEKMTLLLITHNMGVVAEMCDRVAVMYAGKIVEIGTVHQIFKNPQHPYTKGLLRAVPNPLIKIEKLESIPGTVPNLIFPPSGCRFHPRCPYRFDPCDKKEPPLIEVEEGHKVACWLYVK